MEVDKHRTYPPREKRKSTFPVTPLLQLLGVILLLLKHSNTNTGLFHFVAARKAVRLTWINGIGYNIDHMEHEAPKISQYFGGQHVDYYHNPTSMMSEQDVTGYYKDLTQAGRQKYLGILTKEVHGLVQHFRNALSRVGKHGRVVHLAHSQGVLITHLACQQLLPQELEQLEMIAIGGATILQTSPKTPFHRCINYYSVNDPLLLVVPEAEQALRSGLCQQEFCFLAPRIGDPIQDHHLLGPTYAQALQFEGKRFQTHYQSIMYRMVWRTIWLFLYSLIRVLVRHIVRIVQTVQHPLLQGQQRFMALLQCKRLEIEEEYHYHHSHHHHHLDHPLRRDNNMVHDQKSDETGTLGNAGGRFSDTHRKNDDDSGDCGSNRLNVRHAIHQDTTSER